MKESCVAISKMFYNLRNELDTEITIHLNPKMYECLIRYFFKFF